MNNIYSFSYDPDSTLEIEDQLIEFIASSRNVVDWNHPYRGMFFIYSDRKTEELAESFNRFFSSRDVRFTINHVILGPNYGRIPEQTFKWLRKVKAEPEEN